VNALITIAIVAAIVGGGLVTGLLFAFSNFVMRALAQLPAENGMFAMQRINETIINPLFLTLFLGTPLLCAIIGVQTVLILHEPGSIWLLVGAITYLIGPFGITVLCNVPLNNQLARVDIADAANVWPMYQQKWQRWNHIRTYVGVASVACMAAGLSHVHP
jgi:uncharacterized membrane protein